MDPLSQATFGAAAGALAYRGDSVRKGIIVGVVAGAAPDLDVLIRSSEDPLLALEYHRHFTHALFFAPFFGALFALLFQWIFKWRLKEILLPAILATLSHGILDACTSYGTLLYLPFTDYRESWNVISIIDPIFTLPLVVFIALASRSKKIRYAQIGFGWAILYLFFGYVQRERAEAYAERLAESRGLTTDRLTTRPSIANILLWRMIVYSEGTYYVDAVNLLPFRKARIYEGATVNSPDLSSYAAEGTKLARDILRFNHFSQGYLYEVEMEEGFFLGDLRYSKLPDEIDPLWGISFNVEEPDDHVEMVEFEDLSDAPFGKLGRMLIGIDLKPLGDQSVSP